MSISVDSGLPIDLEQPWDAAQARTNVKEWATKEDGEVDWSEYGKAFVFRQNPEQGADPKLGDFAYPFADSVDGK